MTKHYTDMCMDCGRTDEQILACGCSTAMLVGDIEYKPEDDDDD